MLASHPSHRLSELFAKCYQYYQPESPFNIFSLIPFFLKGVGFLTNDPSSSNNHFSLFFLHRINSLSSYLDGDHNSELSTSIHCQYYAYLLIFIFTSIYYCINIHINGYLFLSSIYSLLMFAVTHTVQSTLIKAM